MFNNHFYIILTNDQVAAAKEEFFRIFEAALNGMIETRFMRDTAEVLTLLLLLMLTIIIAGSCIIVLTLNRMTETMFMRNTADVMIVIVMIIVFHNNMASPK